MQGTAKPKGLAKVWREIKRPFQKIPRILGALCRGLTLTEYDELQRFNEWRSFLNDERLYTFCPPQEKKELFTKYVNLIEIEVFSLCNRKCWFCPNSYIDRHSENSLMPPEVFSKVIGELEEVGYSGNLGFHRFNEPFADRITLERICEARKKLPQATLYTNSNGDYLTREYLDEIADAGLDRIWIMRYPPGKNEYSAEESNEALRSFASKMDLPIEEQRTMYLKLRHPVMNIEVCSTDPRSFVRSRAGTITTTTFKSRTSTCLAPFLHMYIDYNGSVMPCCNMRSDVPQHTEMIMGNCAKESLFEIYTNTRYSLLRYQMRDIGYKVYPCNVCDFEHYSFSLNNPDAGECSMKMV